MLSAEMNMQLLRFYLDSRKQLLLTEVRMSWI